MNVIFDIRTDKSRTPLIQKRIKEGPLGFRTKWGLYGTDDWLNNIRTDNLIEVIHGSITKLLMTGHNDFPEFEINDGTQKFQFERLGNVGKYEVGKKIKVEAIKNMYINPSSGLDHLLTPLIIEIED